jgi:RNA polymerase sigma factor (sigma-70 family)
MTVLSTARGADPPAPPAALPIDAAVAALHAQRRALLGIAISLVRDVALAQDVVQDTVEAILRRRPSFADEAAALAYARVAVANRCRSVLRRQGTARRHLGRFLERGAPPADERVLLAEEHAHLLAQFYRLPPRQREALALRYFAGLDDAESADAMSVSIATVRSSRSRGLATLTRLLKENPHV